MMRGQLERGWRRKEEERMEKKRKRQTKKRTHLFITSYRGA